MNKVFACLGMVALLGLAAVTQAKADDKPLESKREARSSAASVDFAGELGLTFPSLATLGGRIEQARTAADPVGLMAAALELSASEQAGGKKASLTAGALSKEAQELGERRNLAAELKALAALTSDAAAKEKLLAQAAKADEATTQSKAAKEAGEASKGIQCYLYIDNRTFETVYVYIDGYYVGSVRPYGDARVWVGQGAYETTYLRAHSANGSWRTTVSRPVSDFTWRLWP